MRRRIRHALYRFAWALVGNVHHEPASHGRHFTRGA